MRGRVWQVGTHLRNYCTMQRVTSLALAGTALAWVFEFDGAALLTVLCGIANGVGWLWLRPLLAPLASHSHLKRRLQMPHLVTLVTLPLWLATWLVTGPCYEPFVSTRVILALFVASGVGALLVLPLTVRGAVGLSELLTSPYRKNYERTAWLSTATLLISSSLFVFLSWLPGPGAHALTAVMFGSLGVAGSVYTLLVVSWLSLGEVRRLLSADSGRRS